MIDFDQAFKYTLGNESDKYTDDPNDPGGPTKYGITLKVLQETLGSNQTAKDVAIMSIDMAKSIYQKKYWEKMGCDKLMDQPLAIALFDTGVNMGPGTAIKMVQRSLDQPEDGVFGPATLYSLNFHNPKLTLLDLIRTVQNHYIEIVIKTPTSIKYLRGWMARSQKLMDLVI